MSIKFGDAAYFELLSLQDRLKYWGFNKLDLQYLDKLKMEIDVKVKFINEKYNESRRVCSSQE